MFILERYTWWVAAMAALALFLAIAGQVGVLSPMQGTFLRVTGPVEGSMNAFIRPVGDFITDLREIGSLREENRQLRLENEELRNDVVRLQQEAAEVSELQAALGVIGQSDDRTFEAASILRSDTSPFSDVVYIDRGSDDGLRNGMVVLSPQGSLVGTVTETFSTQSAVRLISDSRSAVNAQIVGTDIDGIVTGTATRTVQMEMARGNISVDDEVVTTGAGGNYPRDLPIGRVVDVEGSAQDLELDIEIEPRVRLSTLRTVLVDTSFEPARELLEGE